MIDIHAHILYGIDDGPATMEESISMLKMAAAEGIRHIIATPHYMPDKYENANIEKTFRRLKDAIKEENLGLEISLGNEIYLHEGIKHSLETGKCLTLANSSHVLLELPYLKFYPVFEQWLYELRLSGYRPILAHIERYQYFTDNTLQLKRLIESGCSGQMNAEMLLGTKTRKLAFNLIQQGLVQIVATDCHNIEDRKPILRKAYELVQKKLGDNLASSLFKQNTEAVLNNQTISAAKAGINTKKTWANRLLIKKEFIRG